MNAVAKTTDNRALLTTIGHRLVKKVAAEVSPYAAALLGVALERRREDEWDSVVDELLSSDDTVAEYLQAEHLRSRQ